MALVVLKLDFCLLERAGARETRGETSEMEKSEKLVAGLGGLVEGEQSSHQRAAQLTAGLGVEEQPYRGGSVELTTDLVATQFDMTGRVRQQQPAAAPTASNRGCLHENAVAPNRSAVSLLHLAEQPPAEVVGALSQLVRSGSQRAP